MGRCRERSPAIRRSLGTYAHLSIATPPRSRHQNAGRFDGDTGVQMLMVSRGHEGIGNGLTSIRPCGFDADIASTLVAG